MNTLRIISDKSRYVVAALLVAFSVFVPVMANAAQLEDRSIQLSSSTKSATSVSYGVEFTAPTAGAETIVLDFCKNSPLIGQTCDAPTGFSASGAGVSTSGYSLGSATASKVVVTKTVASTAGQTLNFTITGITNPSTSEDALYARILTYGTGDTAYTDGDTIGSPRDTGSVALAITDGIAVSGDVLESLTFCISGEAIDDGCVGGGASAPALTAPTLKLGKDLGNGVVALQSDEVSTGSVHTQITTNAASGAVVRLKSSATDCGGLVRAGATDNTTGCGIAPALLSDVLDADAGAKFGVKLATATNGTVSDGAYAAANANYNTSNYRMNYLSGNATGVTSVYGDDFLNTAGAPALNKNMELTFGAKAANNTPAGSYSAALSLIATGKF